jgi:hypothetical protein
MRRPIKILLLFLSIIIITLIFILLNNNIENLNYIQKDKGLSNSKKVIVVIRHGQKGPDGSDIHQDPNPPLPTNSNDPNIINMLNQTYFKDTKRNPLTNETVRINYADLSKTGYNEGTLFATTVPDIIKNYQPITKAYVFNPEDNANTYITSYPLLKKLVDNGTLKQLIFYEKSSDISEDDITPEDNDGSILIAGNAENLNTSNNPNAFIPRLNKKYHQNAGELQRGRSIYVYGTEDGLDMYHQSPNKNLYKKI